MLRITEEQRLLLNSRLSIEKMLKQLGIEVRANGTLCCPFHDDKRPSAKLFQDNRMWCFSCARMYDPVDFVRHFPQEFPLVKILLRLEGKANTLQGTVIESPKEQYDFSSLVSFRQSGISIQDFEERLFNLLDKAVENPSV